MHSEQHCRDQAAECLSLVRSAKSEGEAEVLKYLSQSWARLAGQINRLNAIRREQQAGSAQIAKRRTRQVTIPNAR